MKARIVFVQKNDVLQTSLIVCLNDCLLAVETVKHTKYVYAYTECRSDRNDWVSHASVSYGV